MQKENESVRDYSIRLEKLHNHAFGDIFDPKTHTETQINDNQKLLAEKFVISLLPNLSTMMTIANPKTFEEAILQATKAEKQLSKSPDSDYDYISNVKQNNYKAPIRDENQFYHNNNNKPPNMTDNRANRNYRNNDDNGFKKYSRPSNHNYDRNNNKDGQSVFRKQI
jgi:hypothetical protein